jgi:hypothetical protein
MIPRLAPRRNRRQSPLSQTGFENASPFLMNSAEDAGFSSGESTFPPAVAQKAAGSIPSNKSIDSAPQSPVPTPLQYQDPEAYRRRVLSDQGSSAAASASFMPHPVMKSPIPSADISYSIASSSFCSLTPPVTGARPLVGSAKRLGNDVRRKHSKRRKCRTHRGKAKEENNGFCLWKDSNPETKASHMESSDEEDNDVREGLPFLFAQREVSSMDETRKYWEWCYGKGTTIELSGVKGWSATRAPPAKSW